MENKLEICPLFIEDLWLPLMTSEGLINNSSFSFHTILEIPAFTTHYHCLKCSGSRRTLVVCLFTPWDNVGYAHHGV